MALSSDLALPCRTNADSCERRRTLSCWSYWGGSIEARRTLSPQLLISVNRLRCRHARARGGAEFQRALTPTDLHRPAGRRCGCWPTSTFLFRGIVVGRSAADAGARAIGADADGGFA